MTETTDKAAESGAPEEKPAEGQGRPPRPEDDPRYDPRPRLGYPAGGGGGQGPEGADFAAAAGRNVDAGVTAETDMDRVRDDAGRPPRRQRAAFPDITAPRDGGRERPAGSGFHTTRPVAFRAWRLPVSGVIDARDPIPDWLLGDGSGRVFNLQPGSGNGLLMTDEGLRIAEPGTWIVEGEEGRVHTCPADTFAALCRAADDDEEED